MAKDTHHVSQLVVWWTGQLDLRQLHLGSVISEALDREVDFRVLNSFVACLKSGIGLVPEGLAMPVELILNPWKALAYGSEERREVR